MRKTNRFFRNQLTGWIAGAALAAGFSTAATAAEQPGKGVTVEPIFPSVLEEHFRGQVAIIGLEELGYKVKKPKEAEYATMVLAVGQGDADFSVHLWEELHKAYFKKAGGEKTMVKGGKVIPSVLQGYLVDKKTAEKHGIDSLDDLKKPEIRKLFDTNGDGKADLTGCNPGWGCELVIEHHMGAYELRDHVTHNQGSYFALMADTISRYKQGEPILYYTWSPLWVNNVLSPGKDVVWLEVPHTSLPKGQNADTMFNGKNLGFAVDKVRALVNRDFAEENPAAVTFLTSVTIPAAAESAQNLKMHNGEDSYKDVRRHAEEWIEANREAFDSWLAKARAAAK